jgi:hypothetical protein
MSSRQRIQSRPELGRNTLMFLTEDEVKFANLIGSKRNSTNRKLDVNDTRYKRTDPLEIDQLGARAELVIHKFCNQYPEDMFMFKPLSKANKTDLGDIFIEGLGVDVKATKYKTGKLLANIGPIPDIAIFGLIIENNINEYDLKGFMTAHDLYDEKRIEVVGRLVYAAHQKDLLNFDDAVKKYISFTKKGVDTDKLVE